MAHIRINSSQCPKQRLCYLGPRHTLLHDLHSTSQLRCGRRTASLYCNADGLTTIHVLLLYCQQGAALTFSAVAGSTSGYICSFMEMSCETKPAAAGGHE